MLQWVACHLGLALYNIFFHPLRSYPGPILAAATQLPHSCHMIKGDSCKWIASLHERYGDVVRTGPRELSYISVSANRTIFGGRPTEETVYEKNPAVWLQGTGKILNIFFARHREHIRYRKLMSPAFSEAAIREQEPTIQKFVSQFLDGMRNRSGQAAYPDANGVVNIAAWYNFIVFDLLSRLAFGAAVGCLERGDYHPWVLVVYGAIKHSQFVQAAHRLKPYHRILERFIPADIDLSYSTHLDFAHKQLEELQKPTDRAQVTRADFASFMLKGLSQEELEDNVNIIVTAGGDTTATTLTSVTYYLTHNPESYRRLTAEIRDTFQNEDEITVVAVSRLNYLKSVIKETLRIHPSIPVGLHRVVPKQGGVIEGKWVPGGVSSGPCRISPGFGLTSIIFRLGCRCLHMLHTVLRGIGETRIASFLSDGSAKTQASTAITGTCARHFRSGRAAALESSEWNQKPWDPLQVHLWPHVHNTG